VCNVRWVGLNPDDKELLELIEGGGGEMDSLKCIMVEVTKPSEETLATQWLPQVAETEVRWIEREKAGLMCGCSCSQISLRRAEF